MLFIEQEMANFPEWRKTSREALRNRCVLRGPWWMRLMGKKRDRFHWLCVLLAEPILINREIEAAVVSSSWSVTSSPDGGPQQAWLGLHSARAFLSANGISASVRKLIFKSALSHSLERKAAMVGAKWGGKREKHLLKCQRNKKLKALHTHVWDFSFQEFRHYGLCTD